MSALSSQSPLLFMIVGMTEPLYTAEFQRPGTTTSPTTLQYNHFLLHSSLDSVEALAWSTSAAYLRTVEKVNDRVVSAYLTPSHHKFLLLHGGRSEESVKSFFLEVHELFVKQLCSPFQGMESPIESKAFDDRLRALGRRYLS
mmetsp:Transcript_17592/g.35749  ORF Transcript_17592/g.35749 Transcript_17592/m.35749 type:complete len:143 (+) Transcript_17592:145-573(+)